jgi:hypothetical protein
VCGGRQASAARAGPACAAGPERRGATHFKNENSFSFSFLKTAHKNAIWSLFQTFLRKGPKIKVAPVFMLYNFVSMTKVKSQMDFELQN